MINEVLNKELVEIEATAVKYLTAFTRANIKDVMATYADDGVLMAPGMPASIGKDELLKTYTNVLEAVNFNMNYQIKEVVQTSGYWGFVRSSTDGTEVNKITGITSLTSYQELFLMRKSVDGVWQIARYCTVMISSKVK